MPKKVFQQNLFTDLHLKVEEARKFYKKFGRDFYDRHTGIENNEYSKFTQEVLRLNVNLTGAHVRFGYGSLKAAITKAKHVESLLRKFDQIVDKNVKIIKNQFDLIDKDLERTIEKLDGGVGFNIEGRRRLDNPEVRLNKREGKSKMPKQNLVKAKAKTKQDLVEEIVSEIEKINEDLSEAPSILGYAADELKNLGSLVKLLKDPKISKKYKDVQEDLNRIAEEAEDVYLDVVRLQDAIED